jgi:hypothetical protein
MSLNPANNYDHVLHVVSGATGMHDLMFHAQPHKTAGVVDVAFNRGSLCSLDETDGTLVPGLHSVVSMPLWAVNSVVDFDSASDDGNISGGNVTTYPATGGYEIKTTEVELDDFSAGDYTANTLLTGGTGDDLGLVEPVTLVGGAAPVAINVVGVTSKGVSPGVYNQNFVQLWPCYLPARG